MAKNQITELRTEGGLNNPYESTNSPFKVGSGTETYVTGKFGKAYSFGGCTNENMIALDQTSRYIEPNAKSFSFWIKTTSTTPSGILGYSTTGYNSCGSCSGTFVPRIYMDQNGKIVAGTYNGARRVAVSTTSVNDGNWHHVVTNGGLGAEHDVWIDGVQEATMSYTHINYTMYAFFGGACLNSWSGAGTTQFSILDGEIDEFKVYTEVLNEGDVKRLMNNFEPLWLEGTSGGGGSTSLKTDILWLYEMQETSLGTITDSTSNNNDGQTYSAGGPFLPNQSQSPGGDLTKSFLFQDRDRVQPPYVTPTSDENFTYAVWLRPTNTSGINTIFRYGSRGYRSLYIYNGNVRVYDAAWLNCLFSISPNTWTHVVWTWDVSDNTTRLYKNGTLADSVVRTSTRYPGAPRLGNDGYGQDYEGYALQYGAWDRPLTAAEVSELYNSGTTKSYANW